MLLWELFCIIFSLEFCTARKFWSFCFRFCNGTRYFSRGNWLLTCVLGAVVLSIQATPEHWALKAHIWVLFTFGLVSWSVCNVDVYSSNYSKTASVLPIFSQTFLLFIFSLLLCQRISRIRKHKVVIWGLNCTCLTTTPIRFHNTRAEMLSGKASSRCQFAGKATLFMTLSAWGTYSVPLSEKWFSSFQLAFLLAWQ